MANKPKLAWLTAPRKSGKTLWVQHELVRWRTQGKRVGIGLSTGVLLVPSDYAFERAEGDRAWLRMPDGTLVICRLKSPAIRDSMAFRRAEGLRALSAHRERADEFKRLYLNSWVEEP